MGSPLLTESIDPQMHVKNSKPTLDTLCQPNTILSVNTHLNFTLDSSNNENNVMLDTTKEHASPLASQKPCTLPSDKPRTKKKSSLPVNLHLDVSSIKEMMVIQALEISERPKQDVPQLLYKEATKEISNITTPSSNLVGEFPDQNGEDLFKDAPHQKEKTPNVVNS